MNDRIDISDWQPLPDGIACDEHLFVLTDMHGCPEAMERLLSRMPRGARFVFLGDAVDRGPKSFEVVERIDELGKDGGIILLGNHDVLAWQALADDDPWALSCWRRNGGAKTVESFTKAMENGAAKSTRSPRVPRVFGDYVDRAVPWALVGDILFVHAGMPPHAGQEYLDEPPESAVTKEASFLWWRPWSKEETYDVPRVLDGRKVFIVSGHTSVNRSVFEYGVMLDAGYDRKQALEIADGKFRILATDCDEIK